MDRKDLQMPNQPNHLTPALLQDNRARQALGPGTQEGGWGGHGMAKGMTPVLQVLGQEKTGLPK